MEYLTFAAIGALGIWLEETYKDLKPINNTPTQYIEYWAGGKKVHGFNTLDEAAKHFIATKDIAYGENLYILKNSTGTFKVVKIKNIKDAKEFRKIAD